jgi:exonuclease SbcD
MRALYSFVARIRRRAPDLDIVFIGGNHDSAGRLEAPRPLLAAFGVHVVGTLPRRADRMPDFSRLLLPLRDKGGSVAALCVALPFLRPSDLPVPADAEDGDGDPLVRGVADLYAEAIRHARERQGPDQALIVTGHCYLAGTEVSELSERKILGGNLHALPASIFPDDVGYVALGHLHKPQTVGGRDRVRYAGSPLPLSVTERSYRHQVLAVDFSGRQVNAIRSLIVPRCVDIVRVPEREAAPLDEVLAQLRRLAADTDPGFDRRPFVDVVVRLDQPAPALRQQIETALAGKFVRLARIQSVYAGSGRTLADALAAAPDLAGLQPEAVFRLRYREQYRDEPPEALLAAFHELAEAAEASEGV